MILPLRTLQVLIATSLVIPPRAGHAQPAPTADPFASAPASTEIPSPEGPEWSAPPLPPPPPPNKHPRPAARAQEEATEEESAIDDESGKSLTRSGIVFVVIGAASAGLTYLTFDKRRKAEAELSDLRQTNNILIASNLMPQSTTALDKKIKLNHDLSIGFGIGAATMLIIGGVLLLVGRTRATKPARSITWAPRGAGMEVAF